MGFDGFFIWRIDYDDHELRVNQSRMEMVWQGSSSLSPVADIFTGVLYSGYGPPSGLCFDFKCHVVDDPVQVGMQHMCVT